ncbi:MAG: hypothetical protein J6Z27_04780 [Bacteroidales bacterium]|nr:hypothetical protein [Bacteroidales bacterium]
MLNKFFKLLPIVVCSAIFCLFSTAANAQQNFQNGYFLDNYVYGYRLNPALGVGNDETRTVVGFVLNDITIGAQTNAGVQNFLFERNGKLVPFTDETVTKSEFLSALPNSVDAFVSLDLSLLTLGFKTRHGFLTFDARVRSRNMVKAQKDLFGMIKDLADEDDSPIDQKLTVAPINVQAREYFEVGFGYSTYITPDLKFGAAVKLLLGAAKGSFTNTPITVTPYGDDYIVDGSAKVSLTASMIEYDPVKIIRETSKIGFQGYGAAVDLGLLWNTPLEGLSLSAGVTDLGGIVWKNSIQASSDHNQTIVSLKDKSEADIINELFNIQTNTRSRLESVGTTVDLGIKYKMPFYDRLTAGLHGSFGIGVFPYHDIRFGITVTPIDQISLAVSAAKTSQGPAFGAAANFHLGAINIFGGVDGFITGFGARHYPEKAVNSVAKIGFTIDVFRN